MTHFCAPTDTIRITAQDVTLLDSAFVAQDVTSNLTGAVQFENWDSGLAYGSATPMVLNSGNDWYVDLDAPDDEGHYRIVVVIETSGARRTLHGELKVERPPT